MSRSDDGAARWRFEIRVETTAPPEVVWSLVSVASRWKEWSFLTRSYLLHEGSPVPDGVGALRRFAVGRFGSSEEVIEFEPPTHLAYIARQGLPVRHYRADIRLEPTGAGTTITWEGALEPRVPGGGRATLAY